MGLGVGTIAAYSQPGDRLTFFEIDSAVTRIASDLAYFTFLHDAAVPSRIGDGRLSLEMEPASSFDLLVIDAFSSDVVPAHLLTREAMKTYQRLLRPGGILAFNVSNRFYNLAPALAATARSIGLDAAGRDYAADQAAIEQQAAAGAIWIVAGHPNDLARFVARGWIPVQAGGPVFTDDY